MEFPTRNVQPPAPAAGPAGAAHGAARKSRGSDKDKWQRIGVVAAVAAIVILLVGVILTIAFGGPKREDKYVNSSKLQAVFLNTGQVYFGNIKALNSRYVTLTNIYYLQTANNSSSSSNSNSASNVSLVKLGCELHEPYDQMIINRSQVTFWENLQDNGQVAKAVATFEKDNPNGQKCTDQSSSASNNSGSSAQGASGSDSSSSNSSTSNSSSSTNP